MLMVKILLTKYTRRDIYRMILLMAVCLSAMVVSGKKLPVWSALIVVGSKCIDFKRLFKYLYFTHLYILIGVFLMPLFLDIPIYTDIYRAGYGIEVRRYHFGIGHPNGLQFLCLQMFLMYLCWKDREKIKRGSILFFCVLNVIGFFLSRSRTSFILYLICLGCFFILNRKQNRGFCRLIVWSPTICAVFCLAAMYLMDVGNTLISRLDVALEHRLTFASQYIQKYPINLGGHYIYELTLSGAIGENRALDCGYINLMLNNGIVFFILFIWVYLMTMLWSEKEKKVSYLMLGAVYSFYFIMEGALLGFYKNIFIFLFGNIIFSTYHRRRRYGLCEDNRGIGKSVL